jgi:DNA polymerase-3 subunit epsilon
MSVDFVAIDFETANQFRDSPCSVGLTKVKNGIICDTYYSLINPEDDFDSFNIMIHGITEEMVQHEPLYPQIISEITDFIEGLPLVAHYAPFDMGVIRSTNAKYGIEDFSVNYFDSYYISKQFFTTISYKLKDICKLLNIEFNHHNALEDSKACAQIIINLCESNNFQDITSLLKAARYFKMGSISNSDGHGFNRRRDCRGSKNINIKEILETVDYKTLDTDHPFYNARACFTGKLQSMTRVEAMIAFAHYGGIPEKSFTKKGNFLVMGEQDFRVVGEGLKSSKILKAEQLLEEGQDIQLLSESDFLKML